MGGGGQGIWLYMFEPETSKDEDKSCSDKYEEERSFLKGKDWQVSIAVNLGLDLRWA